MTKIRVGDTYTQEVRYTQANVDMFAKISGDNNPIHINPEYAAKTPFGKPIVHGFFAGAIFSKVFGTQWPGEGTIYMFQDMACDLRHTQSPYEICCFVLVFVLQSNSKKPRELVFPSVGVLLFAAQVYVPFYEVLLQF